jgi:GRF zinc finger
MTNTRYPGKQKRLDHFFKPKSELPVVPKVQSFTGKVTKKVKTNTILSYFKPKEKPPVILKPSSPAESPPAPEPILEELIDPEFMEQLKPTKEETSLWKQLLKPRDVAKCKCDAFCAEFTCSKPGMNKGRRFYICAREIQKRCNYFQWKEGK